MTYDPEADTVVISLRESAIEESDEVRPGVIADFDSAGEVVRFEVLDASRVVQNPREMRFAVAEQTHRAPSHSTGWHDEVGCPYPRKASS